MLDFLQADVLDSSGSCLPLCPGTFRLAPTVKSPQTLAWSFRGPLHGRCSLCLICFCHSVSLLPVPGIQYSDSFSEQGWETSGQTLNLIQRVIYRAPALCVCRAQEVGEQRTCGLRASDWAEQTGTPVRPHALPLLPKPSLCS